MQMLSVGIDIGTTHAKATIMNANDAVLAQFKKGYAPRVTKPGWHELDAEEIWLAVRYLLQQCFESPEAKNIRAVCFSAAMHGLMAVDKKGMPLSAVLTWADTRSKREARAWQESGHGRRLYEATGTPVHPMSPLCKLAWFQKNEPDVFHQAHQFLSFKEFVIFRLTGEYLTDISTASATGLLNIHTLQWNPESLRLAGIDAGRLPRLCAIDTTLPALHKEMREEFKIGEDIRFIIGGSDGAMANLGSHAVEHGVSSLTIGTSAALRVVTSSVTLDARQRLFCYAIDKNRYIVGGPLNNGGVVLQWFVREVLRRPKEKGKDFNTIVHEAFEKDAASGLLFLPHLLGERAVQWDAFARAAFIGLQSSHTDRDMLLSIIEGISFALYEILQAMRENGIEFDRIVAGGGFTASARWPQLIADIFNQAITVGDDADASARGAALFALECLQQTISLNTVPAITHQPRQQQHNLYQRYYGVFKKLYPLLKECFLELDEIEQDD